MASSWLPVQGAHQLKVGASLRRAIKARKNNGENKSAAPAKRTPDLDFYAFRYNFKPNSIDRDRPGSIDIRKASDSTMITVEYPSKQSGETHVFHGSENVAKEWDCVLVYDEEYGTFTLEKLDSHAALKHERKPIAARPPPPASPKPPKAKDNLEAQLEMDLLDLSNPDADAEGEDDFDEIVLKHVAYRREEEEEDDTLEELIAPTPPPKPAPPRPKAQAKAPAKVAPKEPQLQRKEPGPQRTDKPPVKGKGKAPVVPRPSSTNPSTSTKSAVKPPTLKSRQVPAPVSTTPPTPAPAPAPTPAPAPAPASASLPQPQPQPQSQPQPQPQPHSKPSRKREPEPAHLSDADEEVLEFGKPAKRTRKMSPVAPVSGGLALPGTSSSVIPPPLIPSASSTASSSSSSRPLAAVVAQQQQMGHVLPSGGGSGGVDGAETESEWDEVDPEAMIEGDDFFGDGEAGVQGDEEDMDEDEFEAELNQQMAEMEEEDDVDVERGVPMSLNDYARGVAGLSDEDSSTSDDSDDD